MKIESNVNIRVYGDKMTGYVFTIEQLYKEARNIDEMIYDFYKPSSFKNINDLNRIMEEMIHQCLPDPDTPVNIINATYEDDIQWRYCLYDLLKNKK